MSEPIEMTGWVSAKKEVRTLKDLRDLVSWCDQYKLKDESVIDYGSGPYLYVDFMGESEVSKATWIECGDHLWGDEQWDVLIETHRHPEYEKDNGPDNYEEARELALERKPAKYDWPTKDRYGDESRPE